MASYVFHPLIWNIFEINIFPTEIFITAIVLIILLLFSALISGSEVAFFSLSPVQKKRIESNSNSRNKKINALLKIPERLLATILIGNNFVNVGIVILSSYFFSTIIDFNDNKTLEFIFHVVVITFLILLFGEIIPKVFATQYALKFVKFMVYPLSFLEYLFRPASNLLINSTSFIQKRLLKRRKDISIHELSHAIELTSEEIVEEKEMLEGIVKFSNIDVEEIMCARVDIAAIEYKTEFAKLKSEIVEMGFSRIPVYNENLDNIRGIIYIKDLISHIHEKSNFHWQKLIRPPYFVPESKKINQLLTEFKNHKNHLAIVVDEYGGTSGLITMEDILEEIVGDIQDESDINEKNYEKQSDGSYIFNGKLQLNDFYKIFDIDENSFDEIKGDADSLAGLLLEVKGEIPSKYEKIKLKNFKFKIMSVDKRRIKRIKVSHKNSKNE